jgi:Domain of unknown function (DU1801)
MVSSSAETVEKYLASLPSDRKTAIETIRNVIRRNLPRGFEEGIQYGMIGYYVPLSRYPTTYNGQPLGAAAVASQKGYMSLYLMNVYSDPKLKAWFERAFRDAGKKLDMGKSCVRFKRLEDLPLDVIGEAIAKLDVDRFIATFEAARTQVRKRPAKVTRRSGAKAARRPAPSRATPRNGKGAAKKVRKPSTKGGAKRS